MANYYDTLYALAAAARLTTSSLNTTHEHIDTRLDALEQHVEDTDNPHDVDNDDVGSSASTHTHTVYESAAWTLGTVTARTLQYWPLVYPAATIDRIHATVATASTSGAITIDVQKSGDNGTTWATVFSTKLTIDATERSSVSAATPAVLGTTALSANDLLKCVVDDAGTGAEELTVVAVLKRTVSQD